MISDLKASRYTKPMPYIKLKDGDIVTNISYRSGTDVFITTHNGFGLKFDINEFDKITAIGPKNGSTTALAGGSNVVVSAGANPRVDSATSGEQTIYTVNVTANPTNVTVSGENGLTARRDEGTSAYYLGLNNNYINAITSVSSKLDKSTFDSYTATADVTPYTSANKYINITNHKISGYDWTNTITAASSNAVTTVDNKFNGTTSYSGYNGKPFIDNTTPKWSVIGDGNRISVTSANNKYQVSWNSAGFATEQWVLGKNYLPKDIASSTYLTIASAEDIYQKKLIPGAGIVIKNETDISVDISVSGDIIPYSAGEGIGIDNHIVSITADYLSANALKDLSGRWQSAADALEASADNWNKTYKDVSDSAKYWNSAYEALASAEKWNTTYERVELSGDEWDKVTDKLDSATFKTYSALMEQKLIDLDDKNLDTSAFTAWSAQTTDWDVSAYSAGKGIGIDEHVISITADYLSANALDDLSGNWESTYKTVETNSGKWETAYETLTTNSADWDEVSAKLNSATFATYSADIKTTIETFSGEFVELSGDFTAHSADSNLHLATGEREKWTSAANRVENSAVIWDSVSAKVNKTEFEEFKTSAHDELEKKLDKDSFESWSANKDYDFYSAGNGIKIENHIVSVSADYALSADVETNYYNKTQIDEKFADFGGFVVVERLPDTGDNKKIYLINDPTSPNPDQYIEYIYTENGWKCIGDTSVDLTQYYKKTETSGAGEISTEFTNTSAWANDTFQPIGNYVTSGDYITAGPAWVLVNGTNGVQWSGLDVSELGKTYVVKSTNGSIDIGVTHDGNETTYDLSATTPDIEGEYLKAEYEDDTYKITGATIAGENGVSAEYNPETNEWKVGLDEHYLSYAQATSTVTTLTTNPQTLGNFNNISVLGDKISLSQNTITLTKGLYHVDLQVNITIENEAAQYYDVTLSNSISNGALNKVIDGSFAHTETLDLSFDALVTGDSNSLEFTLAGLPTGNKYYIKNIQIHEMTTVDSILEATGGQYTGGVAVSVSNNKINVVYDSMSGIGVTPNNELYVKLGKGLSFSNEGGVDGSLSLDEVTEGVVETVQTLEQELNGKLTTNMNISDAKIVGNPFYNEPSTPTMGATLFTVPLTHKINTDTEISFFTSQAMNQSFPIMVGLLEYNFKYYFLNNGSVSSRSQTTWIGDTGLIWSDTRAEDANYMSQSDNNANRKYTFKFKHVTDVVSGEVTDETTGEVYINSYGPEMRSDRAYYLVFFGRAGQGLSYFLADDGYAATTNSDPYLSFYVNNMQYYETSAGPGIPMANWDNATWSAHNDMTMKQINFWDREGEANTIKRPLVMIRNNA